MMRRYSKRTYITVPILSALLGGLVFLWVYGWHVLIPTYTDWLTMGVADLSQHYLGWCFYRNSSWLLPIGMMNTVPYPFMASIVFTDSIPVMAVFFKLLSPILPQTFQYFGIWGLLCFMLQGAIGSLLCLKPSKTPVQAVVGSLLFAISPVIFARMFYHTALGGVWIILLALLPFVYREKLKRRKVAQSILWAVIGALSAGIHQYFIAICGVLCAGYTLFSLLKSKNKRIELFSLLLPLVAFIFGAGLMDAWLGAFSLSGSSAGADRLGDLNFNLNGFWNPLGYSTIFRELPIYNNDQREGLAYLGAGMFALLGVAVVSLLVGYLFTLFTKRRQPSPLSDVRTHWQILVASAATTLVCIVLATVPRITYGDTLLLEITLPGIIESALNVFRANARFVWPVIYMIILAGITLLVRRTWKWLAVLVLMCCVGLQLYDFSDIIKWKNETYNQRLVYTSMTYKDDWEALSADEGIKHVVLGTGNTDITFRIASVAQENKWTMSSYWFGRDVAPSWETWEKSIADPQDDTLYVFSYPDKADVRAAGFEYLYDLGDGMLGAMSRPGPEGLRQIAPDALMDYPYAYSYSFARNAHYVSEGEDIDGVRYLRQNGRSYGPYLVIDEGVYEVTITGDNLDFIDLGCFNNGEPYELLDLRMTATEISAKFIAPVVDYNLTIELQNHAKDMAAITAITLRGVSPEDITHSTFRSYTFLGHTDYVDGGEDIDGVRYLYVHGVSFGPYWEMPAGAYLVTISGENLHAVDTDCIPQDGMEPFQLLDYRETPTEITYKIYLEEPAERFEARVFNRSEETVSLNAITVASVDVEDIEYAYLYEYSFEKNATNVDHGEDIDGVRYLYEHGTSYGPYINLPVGIYEVVFTGTGLDRASADCVTEYGTNSIELLDYVVTPTRISYTIDIRDPAHDLEVRIFNDSEDTISVESITIFAPWEMDATAKD